MEEEENQHLKSRKGCKRHKGKRSYFNRTKNDERKWPKIFARRKVLAGLELNSITDFSDPVPIAKSPDSDLLADCSLTQRSAPLLLTQLHLQIILIHSHQQTHMILTHANYISLQIILTQHWHLVILTQLCWLVDSIPLVPSVILPDHIIMPIWFHQLLYQIPHLVMKNSS